MFGIEQKLTKSQRRWFGLSIAAALGLLGLIIGWRLASPRLGSICGGVGLALAVAYYAVPRTQDAIVHGFKILTWPIQFVVSIVLLGVLFFLIMTPIGLLLRLFGRDPLAKRPQAELQTYWSRYPLDKNSSRYFRMY
jgi:phosphotransferase system  glucose/maltose/N-acetylglucosamine-specific IIC component